MINFCIDKALKGDVTSYAEAEKDGLRRMEGEMELLYTFLSLGVKYLLHDLSIEERS